MCDSNAVKELPETSIWHGAISDEDVALVRRRHAEKVEEWLDYADFATELFALHEKYGIEKGEEGYFAYRKHLRTSYYQKLYTYGPTPDPLDEGCDCIFCRMHADESPAETDCELPEAMSKKQGTQEKSKARRLGQVPAEPRGDLDPSTKPPVAKSASNAMTKPGSKKLGPVPAYEKNEATPETESVEPYDEEYERVAGDTSRYDSVGGVEPDWESSEKIKPGPIVPIYPLNPSPPPSPYSKKSRRGQVPAELPIDAASPRNHSPVPKSATNAITKPGSEKLGLVPAYVKTAGEKAWLKKMSGSVF
ncbi:MAG: hypothetical protein NXI22_02770 [bacterium]|nr:hypothetical protein [bacterium]